MLNHGKRAGNIPQSTSSSAADPVTKEKGKFTPGPWKVEEYKTRFEVWPDMPGRGIQRICRTNDWITEGWKEEEGR